MRRLLKIRTASFTWGSEAATIEAMAQIGFSSSVANKGMEGLALTPDGKTLVGIMDAPLIPDAANPATSNLLRIVTIDIAT
jgi:hypothetical protein